MHFAMLSLAQFGMRVCFSTPDMQSCPPFGQATFDGPAKHAGWVSYLRPVVGAKRRKRRLRTNVMIGVEKWNWEESDRLGFGGGGGGVNVGQSCRVALKKIMRVARTWGFSFLIYWNYDNSKCFLCKIYNWNSWSKVSKPQCSLGPFQAFHWWFTRR